MTSNRATESSDENERSDVDDLFASLGLNDADSEGSVKIRPQTDPSVGDRESRPWVPMAAVLAVGLVVAVGVAFLIVDTFSSEGSETAAESGTDATPAPVAESDLEAQADEIREVANRLGLEGVEVDVRDSTIHLAGLVPSEQDLSALRSAVIASADPTTIDMSQVEVGGPGYAQPAGGQQPPGAPPAPPGGSPPPGFVPPTEEQQENLQKELDRVLTETPLVFDPGSTTLNALQLEVLDTVIIGLLEAHPGVPVRLVGYTDETGGDYENSLLSFDRANAVRDYLISRGVPEFIVRSEGRGEDNATGEAGADRRVEIEVIVGFPRP